jgi:hypothetical protein
MSNKEYAFIILGGPMLLAVLIFLGGCKTLDEWKDKIPDIKPPIQTTPTTTTTTTTTIPPAEAVQYTKDFDWADAEKDNSIYIGGVEIRCLVNDGMMSRTAEHGADAWITQLAKRNGGLTGIINSDGSVTLTGKDFKTSRNRYRFEGYKIKTDQSKLVKDAVISLSGSEKGGTTRGYWRTVK